MKSKIDATSHRFFTCSALSQHNLNHVFSEVIREKLQARSQLKKKKITQYRPIMFALIFLHSVGAIDLKAPYIYKM